MNLLPEHGHIKLLFHGVGKKVCLRATQRVWTWLCRNGTGIHGESLEFLLDGSSNTWKKVLRLWVI
jgi:hypothetical protein